MAACRAEGRRSLVATAAADSPGEAFSERHGFHRALTLDHLMLRLDELDAAELLRIADAEHPDHRLTGWTGTVPDELADAFATAKNAMNDMPTGDLDYGNVAWDAERVRAMAEVVRDRGDVLLTTAALGAGEMAGYTEIVIRAGEPAGHCSTTPPSSCPATAAKGSGCGSRQRWCAGSTPSTPRSWRSRPTTPRTTPTCSP
ncbi:hypothetical protein [Streptomyces sp. NPDC085540]|uniref:hypothetical protein n=1 Tax=Streptomyces sp. NPDC085540 TaxID=3365730 RepID=UPI0037D3EF2C